MLYKLHRPDDNRLDEAEKWLQAAVSGNQFTPTTAYYMACLSMARQRSAAAKQWVELALKSPGLFPMRQEAKELLEKLEKSEKLKK